MFCWPSGIVLAKLILENPKIVKNKTVLDFGAGSGIVSIAAKIAGAKHVIACDIDIMALKAMSLNAHLNNVNIEIIGDFFKHKKEKIDLILLSDVLYNEENIPLVNKL